MAGRSKGLAVCGPEATTSGERWFECVAEVSPERVRANTSVLVWQAYLVPQGDTIETLTMQVKQGPVVRETREVRLKGEGWRSRRWLLVRLGKPGDWSIHLLHGEQVLKSLEVKVF